MKKVRVNMLSIVDSVKAQGVGTAYLELLNLLRTKAKDELDIVVNGGLRYDVLHLHLPDPLNYLKQRLSKGVSLTHVHFMPDTLEGALRIPKLFRNVYAWWIKRSYMKSDYLVVVNPISIDKLSKMGYPRENVFYIPNFVSSKTFFPMKSDDIKVSRKKYGYKEDDFIILGVGQLHRGKGILDFVECARKNPDMKFVWVGGFAFGKFMDGYDQIKEIYSNPPKNMKFTGIIPREEVNIFCNISNVFFFPSYMENFPLVVIEAANTYKPLILRDIKEYEGIFFDKYLKENSIDGFCKIIRELKDNKELYNKYEKCSEEIAKFYSEDNVCKMWIDLYRKISKK